MTVVDLYAGPGGWDEGLQNLDIYPVGLEWDKWACATGAAAGHHRINVDITQVTPTPVTGLIASPPCQSFSLAGQGKGRSDSELLLAAIPEMTAKNIDKRLGALEEQMEDSRSLHTLQPLRWALQGQPEWVALEQVPSVLPLWEAIGARLQSEGYSVEVGVLHAEQFGVPQTRKRAILVAHQSRNVSLPSPTHSRFYARSPERLDEGVEMWVSMSEALGGPNWTPVAANQGDDPESLSWTRRRPSPTIVGSFAPDVVAAPGYRGPGDGPRQKAKGSIRVSASEAAVLQSFPADYPWKGSKGKVFEQVGNAVPPLLARAVVGGLVS